MAKKVEYEEVEFVYTDIDVDEIKNKLETAGAEFMFDKEFENVIFDYPDLRLNYDFAWIRLRRSGDEITLAYKQRQGADSPGDDDGMKEIEFSVDSVSKVVDFFHSIGLITKIHQDKRRIRYTLDGVEFDIDFWPNINPYLEVEGKSIEEIDAVLDKVDLDKSKKRIMNQWGIYKENGIILEDYEKMTFKETIKRKHKIK